MIDDTPTTQDSTASPLGRKQHIIIGTVIVVAIIAAIVTATLLVRSSGTKIVYPPTNACEALNLTEAQAALGKKALRTNADQPAITGDTAVSRCGYTDGSTNQDTIVVGAVTIRSAINDKGIAQNKTEFVNGTPTQNIDVVKDLGDSAYFNHSLGQLNVLDGKDWIIISYGTGSAPETNTVDSAVAFARQVIK